ncbi:hypothetical protein D3C78_1137090 [compost metagenome]
MHALARQVHPVIQRFDHLGMVERDLGAGVVGQQHAIGRGQRLQHPVGKAGGWNLDAVLRDLAAGVLDGQLLRRFAQFLPGLGRAVRIQAGLLEQILVVVHHHRRALERHAPGLAARLAVGHEGRVEALEPGLVGIGLDELLHGRDRVLIDQREHVGGQQHRSRGRLARLVRRQCLDDGFLVGARVDGRDLDARVLLHEVRGKPVDGLGDGAAHGDRVVKRHFHRCLRLGSPQAQGAESTGQGHCGEKSLALHVDSCEK